MFHKPLDITTLNENIIIIGQCWKSRTEILSERNNIYEMKLHLNKYDKKCVVWRFNTKNLEVNKELRLYGNSTNNFTKEDNIHENENWWNLPEFDIKQAINFSKSIKAWLNLEKDNICVIEIKGNIYKFIFLLSCALRLNNYFESSTKACEFIVKKRYSGKLQNKILDKYLDYFDKIYNKIDFSNCNILRLKQIIITKIPKITENGCCPMFKIFEHSKENEIHNSKFLMDENYIITEFDNLEIHGDIKIQLYHVDENKNNLICEVFLNSMFHRQELLRYDISEILFPFSQQVVLKKIGQDFLIDIVLIDTEKNEKLRYAVDGTQIGNLRILSKHLSKQADHLELKTLINEGYNRMYSKLFLQLGYSSNETKTRINLLNSREPGLHQVNIGLKANNIPQIVFEDQKSTINKELENILGEKTLVKRPFQRREYLEKMEYKNCKFTELDLIPDKILFDNSKYKLQDPSLDEDTTNVKPPKRMIGPPRKNAPVEFSECALVAKNTLHWKPITNIKSTFFTELDFINVDFNQSKFEEWFCEPAIKEVLDEIITKKTILCDEKRIFLISISLKTLERKKINLNDLESIIYENSFEIETEDLQNILRVLPTDLEIEKFATFIKNNPHFNFKNDLNDIEYFLMNNIDNIDLRRIIQILLYERKFIEEKEMTDSLIQEIKSIFYQIIESNNLRIILKAILDLGNMINYKYSKNRFKKKTKGFKIISAKEIIAYRGKKKQNNFISFLFISLFRDKKNVFSIFDEFKTLEKMKNEEITNIKDRINKLIVEYNESMHYLYMIDSSEKIKEDLRKFLGFAYTNLKNMQENYKELVFVSGIIRRKFGEDESTNITDILNSLNQLLNSLKVEYNIHNV